MSLTTRQLERDYGIRGIRGNSYVATNGSVQESVEGEGLDIWKPALTGLDIAARLTPGTTLLSIYNNDNVVVPGSNVYGQVALNRPMFVDEIGVRVIPMAGNYKDYRLSANVLWLDQSAGWDKGTCGEYWMNNLNTDEGYGGGGLVTICLEPDFFANSAIFVGGTITGLTSGAVMTVTGWTADCATGTVVGGPFQVGEVLAADFTIPSSMSPILTVTTYPAGNRLMWSPDRLYNAAVGPPEQNNMIPIGHGPNAYVAYADADAEAVAINAVRPLVPLISDSAESPGTFRPPKDSFIIDPGQAIAIQVQGLYVPPVGYYWSGAEVVDIAASGIYSIAAWIRFRQPLTNEPEFVLRRNNVVF